ncbi:YadA-like family protein [uncultured Megasphaera sp.]|uniref:YadA-like family protein n=2 Tax=Megasphaera TaxID=906 RepID=UPI00266B6817|nr:YadA-like family protein [uncultured Megasphaera sp.]
MRRTKRFGSKKVTLSTILTVLALCGSLSVSAADTLNLTTGTTHNNAVTNNSNTENDTVAIGFNNSADNGAITIGSHNRAGNANDTDIVVAVGGKNYANNGSVVVGYSTTGKSGSTVIGQNSFGSAWASVLGNNARSAGSIAIGNKASSGYFNVSSQFDNQRDTAFSVAIGNSSTALGGTSVGYDSISDHDGVALGASANAQYGGTALGTGAETSRNTYSSTRGNGVALGEYSYADRRYGTYGYVPLSDTTASVSTPDSMENDIALANKTGDTSVVSAVKNFYQTYDNDTYTQWKNLDAKHEEALLTYDEKVAEMNSKTYASSADRASDYAILQNLEKSLTDTSNALKDFENEHSGIADAALRKDSALSTYKATASAVSLGYGDTSSDQAMTRQITHLAAGTADTDAVNVAQLKQVATLANNHTAITVDGTEAKAGEYVGTGNLKLGLTETDGQKTYDLKLSNNVTVGEKGADGKDGTPGTIEIIGGTPGSDGKDGTTDGSSAVISVKNGADGLNGESLTRIVYTDENNQEHQVATLDDGLKFTGDTKDVTVAKKLNETLSITGGADMTNLSNNNIGVVADANNGLTVKLAKDLTGINSITGLTNKTWDAANIVSGRAATEDQLQSVASGITNTVNANKVIAGDNISVTPNKDGSGTTVSLKNDITLGDKNDSAKQVSINGEAAKVTAGSGDNQVAIDGAKGQITTGGGIVLGNQTVDAKKADGTVVKSETGSYLTGLDNTTWNPDNNGYVADRAATEGQLKNVSDTVKNISDTIGVIGSGTRDFAGNGTSNKVSVKLGETMNLTGGADVNNLSDNNIGVVTNSAKNGFDIKLSKDLKGLNTAEFNTSITVGTGDNKTVITGDSIRTGNTTINNNGLTINNSDPTKNITIQDGNINMGGNAIHNVGEATEAGDAINKGQFDRTINNIGNGMNEMNGRINQIGRDVNRVGAGAAALASLHPLDFDPDDKGSFAVGFGSYKSEHAAALGAFYRPNEDTMVNLAATIGNNDNMYSAGVSFKIGSSSPYAHMSKSEMAVKLESQDKELTDQNQKIEALESQNQDLNARLAKLEALVASK